MEQLIRMRNEAGHSNYQHVDMQDVKRRSREAAISDEAAFPSGLVEFFNAAEEMAEEFCSGVDKAATPAERASTAADLQRDLGRARDHRPRCPRATPTPTVECSRVATVP